MLDALREILDWFSAENIEHILREWGPYAYWLVFAIIFSETGLLIGFFLPGDSLLFVTGFVASTRGFGDLLWLWLILSVAAVVGDQAGYLIGYKTGATIWNRPDGWLFKRRYVEQTHAFYERHGAKTIILARFVPIVRTFAPFMAGVARMDYRTFVTYNVVGGIGWVLSMTTLGYFLGQVPFLKKHLDLAVIAVIVLSLMPIFIEFLRHRKAEKVA